MALTAQQQAAIDRARGISSTRDEDEDENQLGLSDGQKAAIDRARSGANPSLQGQTQNAEAPTGLFDSSYNAGARGLTGSLMNIPNVVMTEDLSKAASYERDRAARDAAGALPWWERILTARVEEEKTLRFLRSKQRQQQEQRKHVIIRRSPITLCLKVGVKV